MHFVVIGDRRINLDTIARVEFGEEGQEGQARGAIKATIFVVGSEQYTLHGKDAETLRAQIDRTIQQF